MLHVGSGCACYTPDEMQMGVERELNLSHARSFKGEGKPLFLFVHGATAFLVCELAGCALLCQ